MRHDAFAMLEVRGEHPVEASEVQSWAWDQCGQAGNKIQRFQHDMGRAVFSEPTEIMIARVMFGLVAAMGAVISINAIRKLMGKGSA